MLQIAACLDLTGDAAQLLAGLKLLDAVFVMDTHRLQYRKQHLGNCEVRRTEIGVDSPADSQTHLALFENQARKQTLENKRACAVRFLLNRKLQAFHRVLSSLGLEFYLSRSLLATFYLRIREECEGV